MVEMHGARSDYPGIVVVRQMVTLVYDDFFDAPVEKSLSSTSERCGRKR